MNEETTNSMAVLSLVAGALAWIAAPVVGALAAVVAGHLALRQIRTWGGEGGAGVAYLGLALGYGNLLGAAALALAALWVAGALSGLVALLAVAGG
jgi:hypothetical protein